MARTLSTQTLKTGQKAPDFNLLGTDGKRYSLEDFKSKTVLIVFMCNHCPFVKARIGDLTKLQSSFSVDDLQIIGINSNDPSYEGEGYENMVKFSKEYDLNFPYLFDETQEIAKKYGAVCTPDPFLFNSDFVLVYHGRINDAVEPESIPTTEIMKHNISTILNNSTIEKDFDPSIGCSIKWKE